MLTSKFKLKGKKILHILVYQNFLRNFLEKQISEYLKRVLNLTLSERYSDIFYEILPCLIPYISDLR